MHGRAPERRLHEYSERNSRIGTLCAQHKRSSGRIPHYRAFPPLNAPALGAHEPSSDHQGPLRIRGPHNGLVPFGHFSMRQKEETDDGQAPVRVAPAVFLAPSVLRAAPTPPTVSCAPASGATLLTEILAPADQPTAGAPEGLRALDGTRSMACSAADCALVCDWTPCWNLVGCVDGERVCRCRRSS